MLSIVKSEGNAYIIEKNIDGLLSKKEHILVNSLLQVISERIGDSGRLKLVLETPETIPVSIYSSDLGILEATIKYMHENLNLRFRDIAAMLHKSYANVAVSYRKAQIKHRKRLTPKNSLQVPLNIFKKGNTCFESLCIYLIDVRKLSYAKAGMLLERSPKTIWTIYNRAKGGKDE